jgi:hypothetical protein
MNPPSAEISTPALLQLVSEQTMQNLLPLLALKPRIVVQVRSRDDKFHQAAENLRNAVLSLAKTPQYQGYNPEFFEIVIDESSPGAEAVRRKIGETLSLWPGAVVNITGGTKLMSIGAWLAAEYQQETVLYCDTQERRFSLMGRGGHPVLPSFQSVAASLTVEAVMAAHGIPFGDWKFDEGTPALIEFGRRAFDLKTSCNDLFVSPTGYNEAIRRHFRPEGGRLSNRPAELKSLLQTPLPEPTGPAIHDFLAAAESAGLLWRNADGKFLPKCEPRRSALERIANLLDGSWLELYALNLLETSNGRFIDSHWSVEPLRQHEAPFGETDLVCVDTHYSSLRIISCKTTLKQPLDHLAALSERRRDMGGSHAKTTLALLSAPDDAAVRRLKNWGRLLTVEVLIGQEIAGGLTAVA